MLLETVIALSAFFAGGVRAWGDTLAHPTTGTIAQKYLSSNAQSMIDSLLDPQFSQSLAGQTTNWADNYRFSHKNTAPWHFVDMVAAPPAACGYAQTDCQDRNCIVAAITDQTNALLSSQCAQTSANTMAIQFLAHFLGDITQPLHNCQRDRGGNNDSIYYKGFSNANFHSIHDSAIPASYAQEHGMDAKDAVSMANFLDQKYGSNFHKYTSSDFIDITTVDSASNFVAAINMAVESNKLDCDSSAFWTLYDQDPNQDFSTSYYDATKELLMEQIAKAGYRMAAWFNAIADQCYSGGQVPPPPITTDSPNPTTTDVLPPQTTVTGKPGTNTCRHSECVVGMKLKHTCSDCATQVFDQMPSCSTAKWTQDCVNLAVDLCGLQC